MTTGVKVAIAVGVVAVIGGGIAAVVIMRRRKRPDVAMPAMVAAMPASKVAGIAPSPRIAAKKKGSRFARFGGRALRTGLRAGAIAGVPGAAQGQEVYRALS